MLASIETGSYLFLLCSLSMSSLERLSEEKHYQSGYLCWSNFKQNGCDRYRNLEKDPPVEISGFTSQVVNGFKLKLDSGNIREWGSSISGETEWVSLGGPIIGF